MRILLLIVLFVCTFSQVDIWRQGKQGNLPNSYPMEIYPNNMVLVPANTSYPMVYDKCSNFSAKIVTTNEDTVVLLTDGRIYMEGYLPGVNTLQEFLPASGPAQGKKFKDISAGYRHVNFLTTANELMCVSSYSAGECGGGATTRIWPPVIIDQSGVMNGKVVTQMTAGYAFSVFASDNNVYGVGLSGFGELGVFGQPLTPIALATAGIGGNIIQIASGFANTYILTSLGQIWATGANDQGQIGSPSATSPQFGFTLVHLIGLHATKMYVGGDAVIVKCANHSMHGFGNTGLLGITDFTVSPVPIYKDFIDVLPGKDFMWGIEKGTHDVYGVGSNGRKQIDGATTSRYSTWKKITVPFPIKSLHPSVWRTGGGNSNQHIVIYTFMNYTCDSLPLTNPAVCNNQGYCTGPNRCTCFDGFAGDKCQTCYTGQLLNNVTQKCEKCPFNSANENGLNVTTCAACPTAMYSNDGLKCIECEVGTYLIKNASGFGTCVGCPAGTFSSAGATKCTNCTVNQYSTGSAGGCVPCLAGTSSPGGLGVCPPCSLGTISLEGGNCFACGTGTWTTNPGDTQCLPCYSGKYLNVTNSIGVCENCPRDTYHALINSASKNDCMLCPPGTGNTPPGSSVCSKCLPGTYGSIENGIYSCLGCPINTWSGVLGADSINTCNSCPTGTYSNMSGSSSMSNCRACPLGSWTNGSICTQCPLHTWSDRTIFSELDCTECPIGTFGTQLGATSLGMCTQCAQGTYGDLGHICRDCPLNTYSSAYGANSLSACIACPKGSHSLTTRSTQLSDCITCPNGQYLANVTCHDCPAGTKRASTDNECVFCPFGYYTKTAKSDHCDKCTNGTFCPVGSSEELPIDMADYSLLGRINDPRKDVQLSNYQQGDRTIKLAMILTWLAIGIVIMVLVFIVVYFVGGKSLHHLDKFYAEKHKIPQNTALIHKETSCGGVFTAIAIWIVVAFIISSSIDFFMNNSQERQSLILQGEHKVLKQPMNITFRTTVPMKQYCGDSDNVMTGFSNPQPIEVNQSSNGCSVTSTCKDCLFYGNSPKYCVRFAHENSVAFASLVQYQVNITSVVQGKMYIMSGTMIPAQDRVIGRDETAGVFVSLFRTEFTQIKGGVSAWGEHMFDTIAPTSDPVYYGLTGFVESTGIVSLDNVTPSTGLGAQGSGFSICYTLNISPAIHKIEEYTKQSVLNFLAQIAALSAAVIQIIGFIFMFSEFFGVKIMGRIKGNQSKSAVKMGQIDEDVSDVDIMKRQLDDLMHWKNTQSAPHENVSILIPVEQKEDQFSSVHVDTERIDTPPESVHPDVSIHEVESGIHEIEMEEQEFHTGH